MDGKYIVVKKDLENHIISTVIQLIKEENQSGF